MKTRKIVALLVAASMVLSVAGCSNKKEEAAKKEITSVAEDFSDALIDFDEDIVDLTNLEDDDAEILSILFDTSFYSEDELELFNTLMDNVSYEVDEDSIDLDDDEASVDVVFTYIDAADVVSDEDNLVDLETLIDALEDGDTTETTITYELELNDDDEWVVSNAEEVIEDYFEIFDMGDFDPATAFGVDFAAAYTGYTWYNDDYDNEGTYTNASYIDFWGTYDSEALNYETPELYFTVERDGVLIYTSDITYSADCYYYAYDDADSVDGCLPAGYYTVTLYTADGTMIDFGSCTVVLDDTSVETDPAIDPVVPADDDLGTQWVDPTSDFAMSISDYPVEGSASSSGWGWWDYNVGGINDSCIYSLGDVVSYSMLLVDGADTTRPIYYAYYYTTTPDIAELDIESPVYSATITPTSYNDGTYYDVDMDTDSQAGYYLLVVADDASLETIHLVAACMVQ